MFHEKQTSTRKIAWLPPKFPHGSPYPKLLKTTPNASHLQLAVSTLVRFLVRLGRGAFGEAADLSDGEMSLTPLRTHMDP